MIAISAVVNFMVGVLRVRAWEWHPGGCTTYSIAWFVAKRKLRLLQHILHDLQDLAHVFAVKVSLS